MPTNDRLFYVTESVEIGARVNDPSTRRPTDATVVLAKLQREGADPEVITDPSFVRQAQGDYLHILDTTGLTPGSYTVVVRITDGGQKVRLVTDGFVLQPTP